MSVSIGFLGDGFSLITADTLLTNIFDGSQSEYPNKLFKTSFGWIAGAGGVCTNTMYFKDYLDTHIIKSRKDIYTSFLISIKKTQDLAEKHYPEAIKELNSAQEIYSLNYFKDNIPFIELGSVDFAYGQRRLDSENVFIINAPKNTKRIKRLKEKYSDIAKDIKNMHQALYVTACFMDELAKVCRWVNNQVNCGISLVLPQNEIVLIRVYENAKTIKKLYKAKADLSEIMMITEILGGKENG